jgi:hypothetical protein
MKKRIIAIGLAIATIMAAPCAVHGAVKTDRQLVNDYCKSHYKGYTVQVVDSHKLSAWRITHRKGRKIVLVEKVTSVSQGKWGLQYGRYYIAYNKRVRRGKKVVSYCIYNPKTNYIDDLVAVVDNREVR